MDDAKARRAFNFILRDLFRTRDSLANLYHVVREDQRRLRKLEKIVSAFVKPN